MNSGLNAVQLRIFTNDRYFVCIAHPSRYHRILLDWYIMTIGQPAAATSRVALPLATSEKSTARAVLLTESMLYWHSKPGICVALKISSRLASTATAVNVAAGYFSLRRSAICCIGCPSDSISAACAPEM